MRITVSHNKPKEEIRQSVDRSFDNFFQGPGFAPIQIVNQRRSWQGNTLTFSFDAKAGILSTPIKGFVEVNDKDVTIDADFGLLEKLLPVRQAKAALETKIKGLLT